MIKTAKDLLNLNTQLDVLELSKDSNIYKFPIIKCQPSLSNYYFLQESLTDLISFYKKLAMGKEVSIKSEKELTDVKFHNAQWKDGKYVFKPTLPSGVYQQLVSMYLAQLENIQEEYRNLVLMA